MSESSPAQRALEVVVYAPLGVALFARDALPGIAGMFVARGRSEIEQRRKHVAQQVTQAKTIGRFAVRFGGPEVRRRVEGGVATARATAESTLANLSTANLSTGRDGNGASTPPPKPARPKAARPKSAEPEPPAPKRTSKADAATNGHQPASEPPGPTPSVATLAIPDYDELSASQVVGRLEGLADVDLETIRAYESAHRNRRTILGKIAQLRP